MIIGIRTSPECNTANSARNPYACFVDITAEVKAAKEGTYTLANIASSEGGKGTSAGSFCRLVNFRDLCRS